ncbi:MAG: hypothetical protein RL254_292, partial [Planctomycetota bacterium]
LASQKPTDERDARDVRDTVLVGRVGFRPEFETLPPERLREIIDQTIEGDSVLKADIANGTADDAQSRRSIAATKQREFLDQQRRIAPGESHEYVFHGLAGIAAQKRGISLRYKLHGGGDDEHQKFPAMFQYTTGDGAGMWELREWTPGEAYTLDIDPKFVDEQGDLKVRIFSAGWDEEKKEPVASPVTIFVQEDSLEVMANESTFAGNLVSAIIVDGCKLAFLASSIKYYYPDEKSGIIIWAFQVVVLAIARTVEFLLRGFAARSPSDSLAQGRAITWSTLFDTVVGIGLGWTGGVLLIGWLGIRRKEIAVYSGQG